MMGTVSKAALSLTWRTRIAITTFVINGIFFVTEVFWKKIDKYNRSSHQLLGDADIQDTRRFSNILKYKKPGTLIALSYFGDPTVSC